MKILTHADWKKRIAFDNIVYKDVKRYSLQLNTMEYIGIKTKLIETIIKTLCCQMQELICLEFEIADWTI